MGYAVHCGAEGRRVEVLLCVVGVGRWGKDLHKKWGVSFEYGRSKKKETPHKKS